ncbi:MAG TPA: hypothetical protein VHN37_11120, partial [Actinomycetota bacterium]|nr:hypothetical protein [Actinomycetota bacterium]
VYGGALVLVSPLLVFALTRDTGQLSWIPAPSPADVPIVLSLLAGGRTPLGGAVLLGAYAALAGAALWGTWRPGTLEGRHVLLASWVVVPVAGSFAVSFLKPIFQFNYLIVALPGLVLLGAAGAARLRGRWAAALLLVLAGVGAREVYVQHAETNNEQWREVAQLVAADAEPGDGIAFVAPYGRLPFGYYVDELGLEGRAPVPVRPEMGWALGQTSDDLVSGALAIYPRPADDELLDLAALPHERVWVVLSSDEPGQLARLEESLGAYELVEREAFVDVSVRLYERSRP